MTCPHSRTTTVVWLYGEGDEAHASHVARCAECAAIADSHLDVLGAVSPVLPALRGAPPSAALAERRRYGVALAALGLALVAATAAFVLRPLAAPLAREPVATMALLAPDDLDARLDDIHDDVVAAALDVGPL